MDFKNSKIPSPGQTLLKQFASLKKQNNRISLRFFADKMQVSVPYLSRVLKDQTNFPIKRFDSFVQVFKLDKIAQDQLLESIAHKKLEKSVTHELSEERRAIVFQGLGAMSAVSNEFDIIHDRDFEILAKWYILPLLDLTTCQDFVDDPVWISKRLQIREDVVSNALFILRSKGFLKLQNGAFRKSKKKIRFPTKNSTKTVREFHIQMMQKAQKTMLDPNEDFQQRLINGVVFAADPSLIETAKDILNKALYDIAELMSSGQCTEVYSLAAQLIPLTTKRTDSDT